ncbi:guanylate kinase [Allokutzneria albata]|uniref:Guanylate kinase n=1 Tax=Allokutzneria albata TaxID=211114 RepID=A0A1H0DLP0_ALLAB|nr:guanylate kinase [Allokutzneria albata]SDN71065.1 guanylate kinase [Allokutzneria albata]
MTAERPGSGDSTTVVRPRLTVVSGPSGVGKSSVLAEVRRMAPDLYFSVSATTRSPRPGEIDGTHYHFVDRDWFQRMIEAGEILEHAEYAGNHYGTPRAPVLAALDAGRPAVLEIELQGARLVRRAMPEARLVMLVPPSWEVLVDRLTGRGTEDPAVVERRLRVAREELAAAGEFDHRVVNADVRQAAAELVNLMVGPASEVSDPPEHLSPGYLSTLEQSQ